MTREELVEIMARAIDSAAGTHSKPPYANIWGDHVIAILAAIEAAGLCVVPVDDADGIKAGLRAAPKFWRDYSTSVEHMERVRRAMIETGKL